MNTLERYILRSFMTAFVIACMVLTFVLSVGFLFKVFQFIMRGVSLNLVLDYLLSSLPEVIGFTIPLSLLVASLLVFSRMSSDSEISAMKACGVSFLTIMRGPLLMAVIATGIGFYLQNYAMPNGHFVRRTIGNRIAVEAGVQLLEPGRFIDEIDNLTVFCDRKVDKKDKDNVGYTTIQGLLAIDRSEGYLREITAKEADMRAEGNNLIFRLKHATLTPPAKDIMGTMVMDEFNYVCTNVISRSKTYNKKPKDFTFGEMCRSIKDVEASDLSVKGNRKYLSKLRFIFHYRIVWAMSSFCFVLLGVPLGCQAQRKESSKGMIVGLSMGILFFVLIMLSESLSSNPSAYPWVIVWLPVAAYIGMACYVIPKNQ